MRSDSSHLNELLRSHQFLIIQDKTRIIEKRSAVSLDVREKKLNNF